MEITTCIVCCEEGSLIKYKHRCGTWYIHHKCLNDWNVIHPNECIICREYIEINNRLALEIDIENNENSVIIHNSNNNKINGIDVILLYFCIIFLIILLILGFGGILIINIFNIPI